MADKVAYRNLDIYVDGVRKRFKAGDKVPADVVKLVDNPSAFEDDEWDPAVTGQSAPLSEPVGPDEESFDDEGEEDELESFTVADLTEYAAQNNIELTSTKKADIIAQIREAQG